MDRYLLNKGFSLLEMAVIMGVTAVLLSAVAPVALRSMEIKAADKTVAEIKYLQEAAKLFYKNEARWPIDFQELKDKHYINSEWDILNPWRLEYFFTSDPNAFYISTKLPSRAIDQVRFHLPQSSVNRSTVTTVIPSPILVPTVTPGVIVAWSGTIANIPDGWVLCDGNNGTPDLRDKFIIGARQDENNLAKTQVLGRLDQTGGSVSHNHTGATQEHALTIEQIPSHQHSTLGEAFTETAPWGVTGGRGHIGHSNSDWDNYFYLTSPTGGGQGHRHGITADNHLPPFYALAFIMKL